VQATFKIKRCFLNKNIFFDEFAHKRMLNKHKNKRQMHMGKGSGVFVKNINGFFKKNSLPHFTLNSISLIFSKFEFPFKKHQIEKINHSILNFPFNRITILRRKR